MRTQGLTGLSWRTMIARPNGHPIKLHLYNLWRMMLALRIAHAMRDIGYALLAIIHAAAYRALEICMHHHAEVLS